MGNPNLKRHSPRGLVNHGPGKGDKARHKLDDAWRANYDAIDWHRGKFSSVRVYNSEHDEGCHPDCGHCYEDIEY